MLNFNSSSSSSDDFAFIELNKAYEAEAAELRSNPTPSVQRITNLFLLMKKAIPDSTTRSVNSHESSQIARVEGAHDKFLASLNERQSAVFKRVEKALKDSQHTPTSGGAPVAYGTEKERTDAIERLKNAIDKLSTLGKSVSPDALLSVEGEITQLLASQPKDLSEDEKAKTTALCDHYLKSVTDSFVGKIKACKTWEKAYPELEKAIQFFTYFKEFGTNFSKDIYKDSANRAIEAFWQVSNPLIGGSKLEKRIQEALKDREKAVPLYETLELQRTLLLTAGRTGEAAKLADQSKRLNDEFHFKEGLIATRASKLGADFAPIAVTTSKTAGVALPIIYCCGTVYLMYASFMEQRAVGKSEQEIFTDLQVKLATQLLVVPVVNEGLSHLVPERVKKHTPEIVKVAGRIAVGMAVAMGVETAVHGAQRLLRLIQPLPTCPSVQMCDKPPHPFETPVPFTPYDLSKASSTEPALPSWATPDAPDVSGWVIPAEPSSMNATHEALPTASAPIPIIPYSLGNVSSTESGVPSWVPSGTDASGMFGVFSETDASGMFESGSIQLAHETGRSFATTETGRSLWNTVSSTATLAGSKLKEIGMQATQTRVGKATMGAVSAGVGFVGFLARKIVRR